MINHLVTYVGWVLAALFGGLWWGERGRRQAAEQYATTSTFAPPTAARLPDAPDAELRAMRMGQAADRRFSEQTIERGIQALLEEARSVGRPLSKKDAREEVLAMLYGAGDAAGDLPGLDV